jgi:hypothetical protein
MVLCLTKLCQICGWLEFGWVESGGVGGWSLVGWRVVVGVARVFRGRRYLTLRAVGWGW